MKSIAIASCWAAVMLALAVAARYGWADRKAVETVLLVAPIMAVLQITKLGRPCGARAREA